MAERPLHILIVGSKWPPETFIARLIKGLLERGLMITVATPTKPSEQWLRQPGFHWLFAPHWQGDIAWRLVQFARLFLRSLLLAPGEIKRFARRPFWLHWHRFLPFAGQKWDVIYFPWNSAAVHYLPLFDLGCPVVISCRGSQINVAPHDPQRADFVEGLKVTLGRATAVHCVSEAIKLEATKYGLDPRKAQVIYPAVNPDVFRPAGRLNVTASPFRIIMVGALRWVKGYEFALLAVKQLIEEQLHVQLDIIGDGPERQRVLYTVEDLQLQEVVHLHAQFTPEQVRDKLQQSHVFLLASLSEGVSNAVLEAMACGLPVVTTDCGGMREAVANSVEGFVVPGGDVRATAVALKQLITNPDLCQKMGQAGRQRICRQFAFTQQIESFVSLFRSCISLLIHSLFCW